MQLSWLIRLRSVFYSLSLHIVVAILLVFSFSFTKPIKPTSQNINIVNAVTVDKARVEEELQRLKKVEEDKNLAEKKRVEELQKQAAAEKKKAEALQKQRQKEEENLKKIQKEKELEKKRTEEEQKKLAQLEKEKQELEKQNKLEEEKKKKAEEERKRQEQQAEEKRKQEEIAKRKAEEERKRKEAEQAMQQELAAEQAEEQRQQDLTLLQQVTADIYNKVTRNFNQTGLPEGLSCALRVRLLPGGEVIDVSVSKSSGNDIFDRRAQTAVHQASPLPVPEDIATFERLNLRDITFTFKP